MRRASAELSFLSEVAADVAGRDPDRRNREQIVCPTQADIELEAAAPVKRRLAGVVRSG
jgi:hypothetical protein